MPLIETSLLQFANVLDVAHMCAGAGDVYGKQEELIASCRVDGKAFLATNPLRSRYKCSVCAVESGEAELHFEDPSQPITDAATLWSQPVGAFADIALSELHGILVHGNPMPWELKSLLEGVTRGSGVGAKEG